jgi:anaerobic magnesium-protoporphyrin IX monomethyl ester cyclase
VFKTILCIPPDYDHNYPPLGTPALTAYLKKNGIACSQVDLNLGYRDFLAGRVSGVSALNRDERVFFLEPLLEKFFAQRLQGKYYSSFLPRAGGVSFPGLPYGNNTNSSFYFGERLLSSVHLLRYLDDSDENTFYQFYDKSGIIDRLENECCGLAGISVTSPVQAIAGLTLGFLIKKSLPHIHVCIGGQWPTLYREAIAQNKELFRCFDSVVVFEGESALCELARRVEAGRPVTQIPNVFTRDSVLTAGAPDREEDMNSLPCPDFDGLALREYDASKAGELNLTYETSRGCYWSQCAYCVDIPLPRPSYRRKDAALAARDMHELKQRYNAQYLLFGDPGLSPRQMSELSRQLISAHSAIGWWTMARLDPGFDAGLFATAHAAGLRKVNFGFESACDRVCGLLGKGNKREISSRVIRDCSRAGIEVDLQTIVGLPGESFEDGMETLDFLLAHKEYIAHVTFNTYYLTPSNCVYRDPAKYGVEYGSHADLPFGFFIPFKNKNGMNGEEAGVLEKMYYALANNDRTGKAGGAPAAAGVSGGFAEFGINGESCRLRYRCDPATGMYTFSDDEAA